MTTMGHCVEDLVPTAGNKLPPHLKNLYLEVYIEDADNAMAL
jgi:hypothetical protein